MNYSYTPSKLLPGEVEQLRQHAYTRWMSRDLLQPASDFLKNIGLLAIYAECSSENMHRYLCWHPPKGSAFEVRSGRTREQFEQFDLGNIARGWPLLTLHINEADVHSAVWISADHYETAKKILTSYGITPASRVPLS
jgi:hypothetical protein